jgi:hypothetical protein
MQASTPEGSKGNYILDFRTLKKEEKEEEIKETLGGVNWFRLLGR